MPSYVISSDTEQGWPVQPTKYGSNEGVRLLRQSPKAHCSFCFLLLLDHLLCGDTQIACGWVWVVSMLHIRETKASNQQPCCQVTAAWANILTATLWQSVSQNHPAKPLLNSWPSDTGRDYKCFLFCFVWLGFVLLFCFKPLTLGAICYATIINVLFLRKFSN